MHGFRRPLDRRRRLKRQRLIGGSVLALAFCLSGFAVTPAKARGDQIISMLNLDVQKEDQSAAAAALKKYRGATRHEKGVSEVLVMQEHFWGSRFVVYERWDSLEALRAHVRGAADRALKTTWRILQGSPFDRREFALLAAVPKKDAHRASSVYLKFLIDVIPRGLPETLAALPTLVKAGGAMPGNLRFEASQHTVRPTSHLIILTAWNSKAAMEQFEESVTERHFRKLIGAWIGSPVDDRIYSRIGH